jgi:hypothetical protein
VIVALPSAFVVPVTLEESRPVGEPSVVEVKMEAPVVETLMDWEPATLLP